MIKDKKIREIIKESWSVGWPTAFIMFYEFMIGFTDVYVASKFGKEAQAAYGIAFQLYFIFIIIGIALSVGVVSVVARLFSSDKPEIFKTAVSSSVATATLSGLIFGICGVLFSKDIIQVLDLPAVVKVYAAPFATLYSLAFLFDYILMSTNSIMRSCNMIKKSLWIMSLVCVLNIILDFVLAFHTPLGLRGIAIATVISLSIGAAISLYYMWKLVGRFSFSLTIVKNIFKISWPSGVLQALWQLGALVLFLIISHLPKYNVEIMAAFTNGLKIESAIFLPAFAFNMACAVVVGNLIGKNDKEYAFRGGIITALLGIVIVSILTILVMLNARRIASFLSNDIIVVNESVRYIYIALLSEPIMAWGVILGGGLNGAGDTKSVMIIATLAIWLVRIPLCYILGIYFCLGATAIWWTMNISVTLQAIFITVRYYRKKWVSQAQMSLEV